MKLKVLFVCLGNICRSPLAEALFKDKVNKKGLSLHFEIDSCGTSDYHIGDLPDDRTMINALKNGISMDHRGRQFSRNDLEEYQIIVAMDRSNYNNIIRLSDEPEYHKKVVMMRTFDPKANHEDVPDPYYGGERGFQDVFEILDRSTEELLAHLYYTYLLRT